jgi:hypothetical protein
MGLADIVVDVLEAQEWPVDTDDLADGMVRTAIRTPGATFAGAAVVDDDEGQLVFYAVRPEEVPADRRADVVELITRANARLAVGSLELDLDAGQLRARTSLDMGAGAVPDDVVSRMVDNTVRVAVVVAHTWFPAADSVVSGELTVAQAAAQATGK